VSSGSSELYAKRDVQLDIASLTAVTHVFAQDMRTRKRGKILLVASLLACQGVQNFAVYSAAKAYVLRLGSKSFPFMLPLRAAVLIRVIHSTDSNLEPNQTY